MTARTIKEFQALTGPDALTPAETRLIEACRAGEPCELGTALPASPTQENTIRADLLRVLITGGTVDCGLDAAGVMLTGGWITGQLDLSYRTARGRTWLDKCRFGQRPNLEFAQLQSLSLDGSALPGLWAQHAQINGSAFLRGTRINGTVDLTGADIGGQLTFTGATLDGKGNEALYAQGVKVGADLFLSSVIATGTVAVNGADIGRQLVCASATFDGKDGKALNAQGVKVGAELFLSSVIATGTVAVNGSDIGGQLACDGATFDGKDGKALNAQGVKVGADLLWCNVKKVAGSVNLNGAHVCNLVDDLKSWPNEANQLHLDGFTYDRIAGTGAPVSAAARLNWLRLGANHDGEFYPQPYTQLAKVLAAMGHARDARQVRMAAIMDGSTHLRQNRRAHRRLARALRRVSRARTLPNLSQLADLLTELPGEIRSGARPTGERFVRLNSPELRPEGAPPPLDDMTRALARQQFRNDMWMRATRCRLRIAGNWASDLALRSIVGYGYAPWRAAVWLAGLWMAATAAAGFVWAEGSFAPNSDVILVSSGWAEVTDADCIGPLTRKPPPDLGPCDPNPAQTWSNDPARGLDWDSFSATGYALDLVVPILTLGQTDAWAPSKDRGPWGWGLWWGRWVFEVAGWIVTALGAAAITGIIQRGRE